MADTYDFVKGDTIRFTRIYYPKRPSRVVSTPGAARAIVEPEIPAQILPQTGEGAIAEVHKEPRKLTTKTLDKYGNTDLKVETVRTAKVHAGAGLGYVAAVLDDAILVAKQQGLFDFAAEEERAPSIYDTDGRVS